MIRLLGRLSVPWSLLPSYDSSLHFESLFHSYVGYSLTRHFGNKSIANRAVMKKMKSMGDVSDRSYAVEKASSPSSVSASSSVSKRTKTDATNSILVSEGKKGDPTPSAGNETISLPEKRDETTLSIVRRLVDDIISDIESNARRSRRTRSKSRQDSGVEELESFDHTLLFSYKSPFFGGSVDITDYDRVRFPLVSSS